MGIRPKADGENIILTDTHRDLVDDVTATTDEFGTVLGEGINEIAATAKSANDSAGELAARVKRLEEGEGARSPALQKVVGNANNLWANVTNLTSTAWLKPSNSVSIYRDFLAIVHFSFPPGKSWTFKLRKGSTTQMTLTGTGPAWEVVQLETGLNFIFICDESVEGRLLFLPT